VIIDRYEPSALHATLGIDMAPADFGTSGLKRPDGTGIGSSWGRVAPGARTRIDRHDETEVTVFLAGHGEIVTGGERHPAPTGTVAMFEPFDPHVIENNGPDDVVFITFYGRDAESAASAAEIGRRDDRPAFVFSTPPTPNGDLHLGHLSGPYLGADAYVRFQRMNGHAAWHITGSDDYQSYVVAAAEREGRSPAEAAAHHSAEIRATLALMDIHPDQYTVTGTADGYAGGLRGFFSRLAASEPVLPRQEIAAFDAESGAYLYEVDIHGICPHCGAASGGNICEDCGEPNTCADLVDPVSARSAARPDTGTVTRYSLPLHDLRTAVLDHQRLGRVPARLHELADRLFRRERLDVPLTHPAAWGVSPDEPTEGDQVIWVWPEMAYGFLYGIEALGQRLGRGWKADAPRPDWKIVHFFGYDNSFYHSVLYPALYRLAYPNWQPDIDYHVNEFYLLDGEKFSTSRRHAIWGKQILGPESVDAVRFYLSRTRPETTRTNFRLSEYATVVRDELAGAWQGWLENLGERVQKHFAGVAPDAGFWTPVHQAFLARLGRRRDALTAALGPDGFSLNQAADELSGIVRDTTRFARAQAILDYSDSWHDELRTAIALELAAARLLACCAAPMMPRFAARLATALGGLDTEHWPRTVKLLTPGAEVSLAGQVFFAAQPHAAEPEPAR